MTWISGKYKPKEDGLTKVNTKVKRNLRSCGASSSRGVIKTAGFSGEASVNEVSNLSSAAHAAESSLAFRRFRACNKSTQA
jgi:hypothetical protein